MELAVVEPTPIAPGRAVAVYLARLAEGSRITILRCLNTLADLAGAPDAFECPWHQLRYEHTQALRTALAERFSTSTANKHLAALRGILRESWKLGLMDQDACARACDLEQVKGFRLPAGRHIDAGEIRALFTSCRDDAQDPESRCYAGGRRDAAMLSLLYGGGVRRAELVAFDVSNYSEGTLTIRAGKGNKDRQVYATNGGRKAIEDWLEVRGSEPGALLCPVNRGGNVQLRRMSTQAVQKALSRRCEKAEVDVATPHDFRRSHISDLLDAGADISTVARLAGHSQVTTTASYDRRDERTKQKAAELLHVPY